MHERLREILSGVDGLRLALLFGSQAEDRGGAESDVDLAVLAERPLPSEVKARLIAAVGEATGHFLPHRRRILEARRRKWLDE